MKPTAEAAPAVEPAGYRVDDLIIDIGRQCVMRGDAVIPLPALSFDLLLALVRAAPNLLTYDQLMRRVWPGIVVNQETVSQRVKLVRDALHDDPLHPHYIGGIRGRGYRILPPVGEQPRVMPAPSMEPAAMTPLTQPIHLPVPVRRRWAAAAVIGAALLLATAAVIFTQWREREIKAQRSSVVVQHPRTIAVLPFVNMSGDPGNEYFSDGMSEELLNRLAKTKGLRVTGHTSSFVFKGKNEDVRTIGERLGVESILEGSVRKQEDHIRVTAQLVNAHDGSALWSESYDRHLQGVFEIQDDIANQVVSALKRTLHVEAAGDEAPVSRRPTSNVEAYNSYLRGQYFLRKRIHAEMEQALLEFQRAVTLDPKFALAYVGLSNSLVLLEAYGYRNIADVAPRAQDAIARALELDPDLAEAYAAKFNLLRELGAAPSERRPVLERALALNPNDVLALNWLGTELDQTGAPITEWLRVRERAYAVDLLSPIAVDGLADALYAAGYKKRALAMVDELARLTPGRSNAQSERAYLAFGDGRIDESIRWWSRAIKINPDEASSWRLGRSYECLGDTAAAARVYERVLSQQPTNTWVTAALVRLLSWSGDSSTALALLRDSLQRYPDDPYLRRAQAFYQYFYQTGMKQALASLRAAAPLLFSDPPELVSPDWYPDAPIAVFLSRQIGDTARASTIAAAVHAFADQAGPGRQFWANWMRARTAAALGDRIGVAKYLDELYRIGSALPAPTLREPLFKAYASDPEIAPRLARHAERRAAWRRQVADEGL